MHLIYIDDSRDEKLCVFSALAIPIDQWHSTFQIVRDFRRELRRTYGIYVYEELHAWKFVSGRGRPSDRIVTKGERATIFKRALEMMATFPDAKLFNAVFPVDQDERAFERMLNRINRALEEWDSYAVLVCDEGKEVAYTRLVRMVDFSAYALLRRERPVPSKTKYGLDMAFNSLAPILMRKATRKDPEGIIRP